MGILMGAFGPRLHMITYTTRSANLMLRGLGLSTYLACLGLDAGAHFLRRFSVPKAFCGLAWGLRLRLCPCCWWACVR